MSIVIITIILFILSIIFELIYSNVRKKKAKAPHPTGTYMYPTTEAFPETGIPGSLYYATDIDVYFMFDYSNTYINIHKG